ncbi:glycosyltransferase family 39 protein [Dyella sp. LX-66]|uniref:glycosyltransferase family 39 protein n=1 Tax=unclassified Dyella TaxID=2634549 RepID=UPI001BE05EE5|nr:MULTISPECIES: glycosyltransferase family 39 protein [unclassified Dyella]MBT2117217.1 glycosyltransferase family 39 protein [Dyella sp. LX-1]MBT2138281.1 glycosyltransferase family 39 protein [Dyella sp. LX-66]
MTRLLSLGGCVAVAAGLALTPALQGLHSVVTDHNLIIFAAMLLAGAAVAVFLRWSLPSALLLVGLLLLLRFVGAGPLLAAALLVAAAAVIGSAICRADGWSHPAIAVLVGLAVLSAAAGWLLPFPVHYFASYLVVLGAIAGLGRHRLLAMLRGTQASWRNAVGLAPVHAGFAVLVVLMGGVALCAPTVQYDDLATHILLPEQLVALGYYKMDVASQIWSTAPWASDVIQGYIALLAGHEARGAANLIWYSLTVASVWTLASELGLSARLRWLAVALYASMPIVVSLNGSMQADTAITTVTVALAALSARLVRTREARLLLPFFLIGALGVALKATQGLLVLPLALVLLGHVGWRAFLAQALRAAIPVALIAGSSYVYAFYITGNPVFPLFNGVFKSSFGPLRNFDDPRWHQGLHWDSLWRLTFQTDRYLETIPGAIGFSMLALSGGALWTLLLPRIRWITLALLATTLGMFLGIQYVRYVAPLFPALFTLGLLAWERARLRWGGELLLGMVAIANVVFMPASLYIFGDDLYWRLLHNVNAQPTLVKEQVQRSYGVELVFAKYLSMAWPNGYSLFLSDPRRPFIAPFNGQAFNAAWYDTTFHGVFDHANEDASGALWTGIFERTGMSHVLTTSDTPKPVMASLKSIGAVPEFAVGDAMLWRLCKSDCDIQRHPLIEQRDIARNLIRHGRR